MKMATHIVAGQPQIRQEAVNIRHSRYDNTTGVYAEMLVIGNVNFFYLQQQRWPSAWRIFFGSAEKLQSVNGDNRRPV